MGNHIRHKPEVAIFNGNRVLIAVKEVEPEDHVTDPARRQMALPPGHDVHMMIRKYKASPDFDYLEPIWEIMSTDAFTLLHVAALSTWQAVEDAIFELFSAMLGARDASISSALFYSADHLSYKLSMTDAISAVVLAGSSHLLEWDKLKERSRKRSHDRNRLAHFNTIWVSDDTGTYKLLRQAINDRSERNKSAIDQQQLEDIWRSFCLLCADIRAFTCKIREISPSPSPRKSPSQ
ncbi:MAG: hypothetical protein IPK78_07295 [Rhodospirillales bacterium]|nr:hypothetical protein [Rhodospirillales bacterium]